MITNLDWLIKLRWFALSLQSVAVPLALKFTYLADEDFVSVVLLVSCVFLFNLLCQFRILKPSAFFHLCFDLFVFCGLIYFCGKIENPFWDFFYFHIMMGAFILPKKQDFFYLPLLFGSMVFISWASITPYTSIIFNFVPQLVIAIGMWISMRSLALIFFFQEKEISLLHSKKALFEKHKQLSLLVSGIVHELGTPLNTVRLKIDKAKSAILEKRDIEILEQSVDKLERTTHQLNNTQVALDQAHIEKINLSQLVSLTVSILEKDFSVKITSNIASNIYLTTNTLAIQLFLSNCVQNCVDEKINEIYVDLSKTDNSVCLKVFDHGDGFSSYILENFKAPYNTSKGQGRGLGLYNLNLALEALGGQISIYNDQGAVVALHFNKVVDD